MPSNPHTIKLVCHQTRVSAVKVSTVEEICLLGNTGGAGSDATCAALYAGRDTLCATSYARRCRGSVLFAGRAGDAAGDASAALMLKLVESELCLLGDTEGAGNGAPCAAWFSGGCGV